MKKITYTNEIEFMKEASLRIKSAKVLLDIGCGIRPHTYANYNYYIACEPFDGYVSVLKNNRAKLDGQVYMDSCVIILNEDWRSYLDKYEEYSVDTVYIIDVIEHLNKDDGRELLSRTEKIAKKQIVIFTPLEFIEQKTLPEGKDAWGLDGADWQEHKSVWTPADFYGDEWEFVVCENFHKYNNIGEKLNNPVGAFWAIKNIDYNERKPSVLDCNGLLDSDQKLVESLMENKLQFVDILKNKETVITERNEECERYKSKIDCLELELDNIKNTKGYKVLEKCGKYRDLIKGWLKIK